MKKITGFFSNIVGKNFMLKVLSLVLAAGLWFYIVNDVNEKTEEERLAIQKILPSFGMVTKKLVIKPVIVGKPKRGYRVGEDSISVLPEFCIVVGPRNVLNKVRYIFTMPIDVSGQEKVLSQPVALKPIAPGIYVEETLVSVTVPVEKEA